jgi:hydrogenase expression/formation protein HypE
MTTPDPNFTLNCPAPISDTSQVQLAHGGGGKLSQDLIEGLFAPAFSNPLLDQKHDGAVIEIGQHKLAFSTDSYVVNPLSFPGGDIGHLAIYGTVNDLAMCGARAQWLSAGFIIEEGLSTESLKAIIQSMSQAAKLAKVQLVTADTKVVDKGKGDGIFINTAGIGIVPQDISISPKRIQAGDLIILNGDVGRHGIAIMSVREGLTFENAIESDCAPLADLVMGLIEQGIQIHCLRDLTRGGLATALNEIAQSAQRDLVLEEKNIPVNEQVMGACEMLGLDPLYVANEGRFIAFVPSADADKALRLMRQSPYGKDARVIGEVNEKSSGLVSIKTSIGISRVLDMLSGEQLPRIC